MVETGKRSTVRIYHDEDADLALLAGKRIAVVGYGNQGRAQALNLRDSGLRVTVGNREDEYASRAQEDGFTVLPIQEAAAQADVVMMLIPDEVIPDVLVDQVSPHLGEDDVLCFASGYTIAFGCITPPPSVDVVLVAPRMIGAGVRDLYAAGCGFPSFVAVAQDHSGTALQLALALAKGIGSTRTGAVEVTFAQEAELDLFTEQCFGPAFGQVLMTAVDLLIEEGYPPEAVLLELYMSGELAYTLAKIAELGTVDQTRLHSPASQYGSMSRGMRFVIPELRAKMQQGLQDIRSGRFAQEWTAEQEAGCPTLELLRQSARSLPLYGLEQELLQALDRAPGSGLSNVVRTPSARGGEHAGPGARPRAPGPLREAWRRLRTGLSRRRDGSPSRDVRLDALDDDQLAAVLRAFLHLCRKDPALRAFAQGQQVTTHYTLTDTDLEFYLDFGDGEVSGDLGPPPCPAQVQLQTKAGVLDGMFTGRVNAMRATMTGQLSFSGEARLAMGIQRVQNDLCRLYGLAREQVLSDIE